MIVQRKTVAASAQFQGLGLHSGVAVTVDVHPGESGIRFRLGEQVIEAIPANVSDTTRCTSLGPIRTIEHIMSALAAHQITDAEIELTTPELPGLDGSAREYWRGLGAVGSLDIGEYELDDIYTRLYVQAEDGVKIAVGKGTGHWRFDFDSGERWPGAMSFECLDILASYGEEISPARTTVFASEIEIAKAAGLGQGLDEHSVLILGPEGYGNQPRFPDEPARHKLLDLVGDLALAGVPIGYLNVVASKSGHSRNVEMAALIYEAVRASNRT